MQEKIAVIGLGYVGLPLLLGLARHFDQVIGFDIDERRVAALRAGQDWTSETESEKLKETSAILTSNPDDIKGCTFYIATVPTPIDEAKRPDLKPLMSACKTIGEALRNRKADKDQAIPLIVFESTVYPGLTEEMCGPKIAEFSGLTQSKDFKLGYSPERINPGDKVNRLESIVKIISAEDAPSLDRLTNVYGGVVKAELYRATSIRVAEAAKVLENTQRDLNVALMNELAIICDRMDIRTHDVLAAAGTKWNFLKFTPGLVGGHCIGVDPYYLTWRAEELGYNPQVILAGRRINDNMPIFVAQKVIKLMVGSGITKTGARIGIMGLTFKENVRDLRNSRVPEIVRELQSFGATVLVHDPLADAAQAKHEYNLELHGVDEMKDLDVLILAVPHAALTKDFKKLWGSLKPKGWVIDIKSVVDAKTLPEGLRYWSL